MNIRKLEWLKRTLGPGILFASTAIGVSHLVQSTRAGANYGFGLLFFIIIANLSIHFLNLALGMPFQRTPV